MKAKLFDGKIIRKLWEAMNNTGNILQFSIEQAARPFSQSA
jgi:hypothetical protein